MIIFIVPNLLTEAIYGYKYPVSKPKYMSTILYEVLIGFPQA